MPLKMPSCISPPMNCFLHLTLRLQDVIKLVPEDLVHSFLPLYKVFPGYNTTDDFVHWYTLRSSHVFALTDDTATNILYLNVCVSSRLSLWNGWVLGILQLRPHRHCPTVLQSLFINLWHSSISKVCVFPSPCQLEFQTSSSVGFIPSIGNEIRFTDWAKYISTSPPFLLVLAFTVLVTSDIRIFSYACWPFRVSHLFNVGSFIFLLFFLICRILENLFSEHYFFVSYMGWNILAQSVNYIYMCSHGISSCLLSYGNT